VGSYKNPARTSCNADERIFEPLGVDLSFSKPEFSPAPSRRFTCGLFSAEYVRLVGRTPFEFAWTGTSTYLASHDLQRSDGETIADGALRVHANDLRRKLTFLPPGCAVTGWTAPARAVNSFTAVFFDPEAMAREVSAHYPPREYRPLLYFENENLRSSMAKLEALLRAEGATDRLYAETLGLLIAIDICRMHDHSTPPHADTARGGLSDRQTRQVVDFMQSNLDADLSLMDLAACAGTSQFHFARAFKKRLGRSPLQHVTALRIERARELLAQSELSVAAIAKAVGYNGPIQFTRAFSRLTGMSPSQYRRAL
jgi:AraC family transcriptional regulator